jgi:hypothetical protein
MKYMPRRGAQSRMDKRLAVSVRQLCASKHRTSRAGGFFVPLSLGAEVGIMQPRPRPVSLTKPRWKTIYGPRSAQTWLSTASAISVHRGRIFRDVLGFSLI